MKYKVIAAKIPKYRYLHSYFQEEINCFIVIPDNTNHDTAHALWAIKNVKKKYLSCTSCEHLNLLCIYLSELQHILKRYQCYQLYTNLEFVVKK